MRLAHHACATPCAVQVVNTHHQSARGSNKAAAPAPASRHIVCRNGDATAPTKAPKYLRAGRVGKTVERNSSAIGQAGARTQAGVWRIYRVQVPVERDTGKEDFTVFDALLEAVAAVLGWPAACLPRCAFSVVRKSFDARGELNFVYTVDLDVRIALELWPGAKQLLGRLRPKPGRLEYARTFSDPKDLVSRVRQEAGGAAAGPDDHRPGRAAETGKEEEAEEDESGADSPGGSDSPISSRSANPTRPRVVVVGSGPAGLFAALALAECGVQVTVVERGQPVHARGRDIGKLMVRHILEPDSNLCFGEGGAGTWSDGKLTTRTGRNGTSVQTVLATLVRFGAPPHILVDGKPHVGTDKLIHILRTFRHHLEELGVKIMFGTRMEDLEVRHGRAVGVKVKSSLENFGSEQETVVEADAVVLAVGHSARDVYQMLLSHNVVLSPKDFAVGFRVEHPQELINEMQYRKWAAEVQQGKGKVPVADYKVAVNLSNPLSPDGYMNRGCYSFCMCPGGQIVPTSTIETELCINGMSFSRRSSKWANAAIVVSVSSSECKEFVSHLDPLPGVAFQRQLEQEAARRGGGQLVAPAQTVPDFLDGALSGSELPPSSYRLGVKAAHLHDLLPACLTDALRDGLVRFDRQMPGFIDRRGLLHGIETRTSSPLRIDRHDGTFECVSMKGLYPIGEGAGYAGGIVSAASDGMHAGLALASNLYPAKVHLIHMT